MSKYTIKLSAEQIEAFGRELDALYERERADLGEQDVRYLRKVMRTQRLAGIGGRAMLYLGWLPPFWLGGVTLLSLSKILDNMEIGHNIMHGQYDWTRDPKLAGQSFEWDNVCPGDQWRHSHNYMHHTYTNIVGKDRDVGYGLLRITEEQAWHPAYLPQPVYTLFLALFFQWGVALHDVEFDRVQRGEKSLAEAWAQLKEIGAKVRPQLLKDYVLFPLLAGPFFLPVLAGNIAANVVRNLWTFAIIFCGHFPSGTQMFSEAETVNESRGQWYLRQLLGSANIEGGRAFHILSGHLSHQIEHHLFPDLPAHRYAKIGPEVAAICRRYDLPYNTGSFRRQFGSVIKTIFRLSLPTPARQSRHVEVASC